MEMYIEMFQKLLLRLLLRHLFILKISLFNTFVDSFIAKNTASP